MEFIYSFLIQLMSNFAPFVGFFCPCIYTYRPWFTWKPPFFALFPSLFSLWYYSLFFCNWWAMVSAYVHCFGYTLVFLMFSICQRCHMHSSPPCHDFIWLWSFSTCIYTPLGSLYDCVLLLFAASQYMVLCYPIKPINIHIYAYIYSINQNKNLLFFFLFTN